VAVEAATISTSSTFRLFDSAVCADAQYSHALAPATARAKASRVLASNRPPASASLMPK